ncbi:MAG: hypothetical protein ACKPEY_15920 [Planctomycetota bacterium]
MRSILVTGLLCAVVGNAAGALVALGFVLVNGSRPDPPFPLLFGVLGFVAGAVFKTLAALVQKSKSSAAKDDSSDGNPSITRRL